MACLDPMDDDPELVEFTTTLPGLARTGPTGAVPWAGAPPIPGHVLDEAAAA
jgi:hypothetical protein